MDATKEWMRNLPANKRKILAVSEGRVAVTKFDFESFVMVYFRHILKIEDEVTLSEFHRAFIHDAMHYTRKNPPPATSRTAWVCPRESGKSTWLMMLCIWLGAHGHQKFIALFSATSMQSQDLIGNIRAQFETNELLRKDFPDLVKPLMRKPAGGPAQSVSDTKTLLQQKNGFILTGRGVDTSVLGMRIDNARPSVLIFDDIEKGEASTTRNDVEDLIKTVQDDLLPLSLNSHTVLVGTTTRPNGVTHNLVKAALGLPHEQWVDTENFKVHYHPALTTRDSGEVESMWPEKWSTEFLKSIQNTRSYKKNYALIPSSLDSDYWSEEDFTYGDVPDVTRVLLSVDPAVTSKTTSDYTGLAVVGYSPSRRQIQVYAAKQVKATPSDLRETVLNLLTEFPAIGLILIETNQGGDLWASILHHMPVKVKTIHQTVKKELRAQEVLNHYQRGRVLHAHPLTELENQMTQFPQGKHDDMIDAVGSGVQYFAHPGKNANGVTGGTLSINL